MQLQRAHAGRELLPLTTPSGKTVVGVDQVPPYMKGIAPFYHPIAVPVSGGTRLVVDARPFHRNTKEHEPLVVNNTVEYQQVVIRAALSRAWAEGGAYDLSTYADFPGQVFVRLISSGLVSRLGLNPMDQMTVSVVAAYYFLCQFRYDQTLSEDDRLAMATRIRRLTMVQEAQIQSIIEELPQMRSIADLIEGLQKTVQNVRIQRLNIALFFSMFIGIWWGTAAREVVGIAMEHPPTFFTLIYTAVTDRTFHSAQLSKTVQMVDRKNAGKDFARVLAEYIQSLNNDH